MRRLDFLLITALVLILASCTHHLQTTGESNREGRPAAAELRERLPMDPSVVTGKLPNGLTYYVRKNSKPEQRAELRLVVDVGSVLEDENQRGLAHFVEHMAFNGTTHFEKHRLVDYLESIGMRFGPDINAHTGFDETVYMLQLPTDRPEVLETGVQILEDWDHGIAFDGDEIEKERGVVIEEWRLRRGAQARIQDEQYPVLFGDSQYAGRFPIGQETLLRSFEHDTLRKFYRDWYRPELMAVVAVGDFDPARMERLIADHFGTIPASTNPRERKRFGVPRHKQTVYAITADPEATESIARVYYRLPERHEEKLGDYRNRIIEELYNHMLNQRLEETAKSENPPFLSGTSSVSRLVRSVEYYSLAATMKSGEIREGLGALLKEAKRARELGFTPTELEREKKSLLRSMERVFNERDTWTSSRYASECIRNYLFGEPVPGIEREYELHRRLVPSISLAEVNEVPRKWLGAKGPVVQVSMVRRDGVEIPTEEQLAAVMESAAREAVTPYVDDDVAGPLLATNPTPSPVVGEEYIQEIDVTRWTLRNGATVILKPTTFNRDEILFTAFSPGGTSLAPVCDLPFAETASEVVTACGVGQYSQIQLDKLLTGKEVSVSPYVDILSEGLTGQATVQDAEALFQLVYLYFTAPRKDAAAFDAFKAKMQSVCDLRGASPEAAFQDAVVATVTQNNPRFQPLSQETVKGMDMEKSLGFYRDRFQDAGDFTVIFVGDFELDRMKPLIETYLGGLSSGERNESWQDVMADYPKGVVEQSVRKGVEPKSLNTLVFTGPFQWSRENRYIAEAMLDVLRIRLRERIREELSGTYGVTVRSRFSHYPRETYRIAVEFGSSPERVDELTREIFAQIESLKQHGPTPRDLAKIKEIDLNEHQTNLSKNGYWLESLESALFNREDPRNILRYRELAQSLSFEDIRRAAREYLDQDNYVKVVLYPENCGI